MDFEKLGEALVTDTLDDSDLYVKIKDGEDFRPSSKVDLEKAKGFLSTVDSKLDISLYDHLADVLKKILRSKIPNALDKFEELSCNVKNTRQMVESDLTEVAPISEDLQRFIQEKQIFYKITPPPPDALKIADEDEDEDEEEAIPEVESKESAVDQAPDLSEVLPDIHFIMSRFNQAGIGLSPEEVYELNVALKDLAVEFKLHKVRFWGKVFGINSDYYIAEAPYQSDVVQENFGWEVQEEPDSGEKEEQAEEEEDKDEEEVEEKDEGEGEDEDQEDEDAAESQAPKIPPIPQPKQKERKRVPAEENGTGVNEYLYFVCTKIGQPWRVLPFLKPLHVSEARYLKRFLTGNLNAEIRSCVPYPGKEAHYLRAQIARITASTYIAPNDYYKKGGEEDEEEGEEEGNEEEKEVNEITLNKGYVPAATKSLYDERLEAWVHYRRAVLDQGRCIPMKLKKGDDEDEEEEDENEDAGEDDAEDKEDEEEEPEILEAIMETVVPLLRSISEDRAVGRLKPWSMKLSSKLVSETAVLIMCSNLWPGAYTFYDGKTFEHIYIGHGYKYSVFHYAPPIRVSWQTEYPVGEDVVEHVDEEILESLAAEGEETVDADKKDEEEDAENIEDDEEKIEEEEEEDEN